VNDSPKPTRTTLLRDAFALLGIGLLTAILIFEFVKSWGNMDP